MSRGISLSADLKWLIEEFASLRRIALATKVRSDALHPYYYANGAGNVDGTTAETHGTTAIQVPCKQQAICIKALDHAKHSIGAPCDSGNL